MEYGDQGPAQGKSEDTRGTAAGVPSPSTGKEYRGKRSRGTETKRGYWDRTRAPKVPKAGLLGPSTGTGREGHWGQTPGTRGGGAGVLEPSGASPPDTQSPGGAAGAASAVPVPCVQRQKMVSDSPGLLLVPHTSSSRSLVTSDMMGTEQEGLCFPDSGPGT